MAIVHITAKCLGVTDYLIEKTNEYNAGKKYYSEKIGLSVRRLNRLLYFAQIECMKRFGHPIFEDEFYTCPLGPEIPDLFLVVTHRDDGVTMLWTIKEKTKPGLKEKKIIDYIFEKTVDIDTNDLDEFCREYGGPWHHNYNPDDINHLQIISKTDIFDYYVGNEKSKQITKKLF